MYWTDWARQAVLTADKNSGHRLRVVKGDLVGVMDLKVLHLNSQTGHNGCLSRNIAHCPGLCVGMPSATGKKRRSYDSEAKSVRIERNILQLVEGPYDEAPLWSHT